MYRCSLQIGSDVYDVTDDLKNWDEIQASFKRDGYGGVVRTFTSKFEFVGDARKHILDSFESDYLNAKASIAISTRNDGWGYDERFSCDLDFTTIEDDWRTLSINAVDNDIAAIIKAKKGTEYEYAVSEVKEDEQLYYDGIEVMENARWGVTSNTSNSQQPEAENCVVVKVPTSPIPLPLYILSEETSVANKFIPSDQPEYSNPYFIQTISGGELEIAIEISVRLSDVAGSDGLHFSLVTISEGTGGESEVLSFDLRPSSKYPDYEDMHFSRTIKGYFFSCRIALKVQNIYNGNLSSGPLDFDFYNSTSIKASWITRIQPLKIDLISPVVLLNRLLKSMNGGEEGITGEIAASDRTGKAMLCGAESIRGIEGAKVYSSFTKFCEWMEAVFGYVYEIQGRKVVFKSRESCFTKEVTKHVYDYSDYRMSLSSDLIYSRVLAGYDKQDYDSVNGRDEFNFTSQYTTGALNTENGLSLISPYRADSFGFELLAEKRGEDTTDNESDKDLFFVGVNLSDGKYTLDRSVAIQGVNSPSTMFNAMFSPSSFIESNKGYIGAFTDRLVFASSDGNAEVTIGGKKENRDMDIDGSLFGVKEVEFRTSDTDIPENLNGMITLHAASGDMSGYLKDADYAYTKGMSAKFVLIMEKQSRQTQKDKG